MPWYRRPLLALIAFLMALIILCLVFIRLDILLVGTTGPIVLVLLALIQTGIAFYALIRQPVSPPVMYSETTYVTGSLGRQQVSPQALKEFLAGRELRDKGSLQAARRHFDRAATMHPDYWEAIFERAHIDRRLASHEGKLSAERLRLAQETLEDISARCPIAAERALAENELGLTFRDMGQFNRAVDHYQRAYELSEDNDPSRLLFLANQVLGLYRAGDHAEGDRLRNELVDSDDYKTIASAFEKELREPGLLQKGD